MLWVEQDKLDRAVEACRELAETLMVAEKRLKVIHPTKKFDQIKWEQAICGMLNMYSGMGPDAILPENTYFLNREISDTGAKL